MGDKLHFKTNIQLKSIIGKDLINDDNIAILELVKNSFDADAKKVVIQYSNLKNNDDKITKSFSELTSRLIIKDNGLGMSLVDIKDKWLNIAYSEKKSNNRQHNRMMAGAKGVGRFSCDRLGEYLNLYTKKQNSNEYLLLKIDWKKFEIDDNTKEIQSIELDFETLTKTELENRNIIPFNQGVLLEIIKLRSNWVYENKDSKGIYWNTDKLVELKKYLEKLINPNQAFENNDFGIYLDAREFIEENNSKENAYKFIGKVENTIFDKLDFKATSIESRIIDDGKIIFTELKDKGQTVFWIKEKNDFFPEIKNIKVIIYYLNPYTKAFFTKQMGIRSVEYGSIYVFLNGFRVPPYGEYGDDWLNLEQRKGQGYNRFLSQRELVGRIEILDNENAFKVISSREGIVRNESYKKLTDTRNGYFFKSFRRLEKYVVDGLDWDSIPDEDKNRISEIEKKIISGETKEDDLVYRENDLIKKRRVYESIYSIISAKADNVLELYINEDLILNKIEEEKLNAEREFEQLISDFENKKIDGDTLNRILQKKALDNKDLEKQINDLSKYNTNDSTTKAIAELQLFKDTIDRQTKIIEELKIQLEKERFEKEQQQKLIEDLKSDKEKSEQKAKEEKEKNRNLSEKLSIEKNKNQYLNATRKTLSEDAEQLVHSIDLYVGNASTYVNELLTSNLDRVTKDKLYSIKSNIDKAIKVSQIIIKSNFDYKHTKQRINLPIYISEYIEDLNISRPNLTFLVNGIFDKYYLINPIEIDIILDNLVSNSIKAKANKINIDFEKINDKIQINYFDNGEGMSEKLIRNAQSIFELGVRDSSERGSGIGMFDVQKRVHNLKGNIKFLGNNLKLKGAAFQITI